MLKSNPYIKCTKQNKNILKILYNYARTLIRGGGIFVTKFYFTESQSFVEYSINTCKYYVCGIKLEKKVRRFHKIRVEKTSMFHLKKCAVNYF